MALQAPAAEVKLQAGVARVEITPASLMPMYGYATRKCGPATGTHDPLFAKALVLATGNARGHRDHGPRQPGIGHAAARSR